MSEQPKPEIGSIGWIDLTIDDADRIRDFYSKVVGWTHEPLSMGDYSDYVMSTPEHKHAVTGICHARGGNAGLPKQWLVYITVADVDTSVKDVKALGGKVLIEPKDMGGYGRYSVIEDPAGAVCALFTPKQ